ncbi:MAG TPA: UDP-N-acetylmuramoyl-L-alanine--D-glutamate ligase [Gemmatimonadaceae bacterium]|nr:UDP-N-acetylmuramoyl-L-alanine--D-glutamate ligase [Gemmatimonadaceae bacterium]
MIPEEWRRAEIAIIGLGRSGRSAAVLLARAGARVYVSDAGSSGALEGAAAELRPQGIAVELGRHDIARVAGASLVVASPGVPPGSPPLVAAREAGVPVVSEVEVALRFLGTTRFIAITGTNGKTTTTALAGHLLLTLGHDAVAAGNIGTPLAEVALLPRHPAWVALEVSSFQLHDTPGLAPAVGVLTNLSPDHLDRYASVAEYFADKALLFRNAVSSSRWVVNRDDVEALRMSAPAAGERRHFSIAGRDADAWYDRPADTLVVLARPLLPRRELELIGDHNVANALAATLAVAIGDPGHRTPESWSRLAAGLRSFRALPHRLEIAGEHDGVLWINDSKATNVGSTLVAVAGMTRPTVLLLGGRHKGEPYTALAEPLRRFGKRVLAFGEAAPLIEQDLGGLVPVERLGASFTGVIDRAREIAEPGDAVLLSPACSSYDMFVNYEHRGAEFRRLAADEPLRRGTA